MGFVVDVVRVEQRHEDVDVQERDESHSSSRNLFTSAIVGRRLRFGRRGRTGTPVKEVSSAYHS